MIARAALNGYVETSVGAATHYHADYVVPVWAATMLKLTKLGRHIFYRWPGAAAFVVAHPVAPVASASLEASSASGVLLTAASQANGSAVPQLAHASASADTPRRDAPAATAPAPPKSQASTPMAAPPVAPVLAPKPKPEAPRRPVPPPSLRVGPV